MQPDGEGAADIGFAFRNYFAIVQHDQFLQSGKAQAASQNVARFFILDPGKIVEQTLAFIFRQPVPNAIRGSSARAQAVSALLGGSITLLSTKLKPKLCIHSQTICPMVRTSA